MKDILNCVSFKKCSSNVILTNCFFKFSVLTLAKCETKKYWCIRCVWVLKLINR